jgi:hypothetical protein
VLSGRLEIHFEPRERSEVENKVDWIGEHRAIDFSTEAVWVKEEAVC